MIVEFIKYCFPESHCAVRVKPHGIVTNIFHILGTSHLQTYIFLFRITCHSALQMCFMEVNVGFSKTGIAENLKKKPAARGSTKHT